MLEIVTIATLALTAAPSAGPSAAAHGAMTRADADALSETDARRLLARPEGSIGLGLTNRGALLAAVALPDRGAGYAIFAHMRSRDTRYGTAELIGVIERAARHVAERYPGSIIGVGNLGFKDGGKIPWSVSHQGGRDADLGFYALDRDGRPTNLSRMLHFNAEGLAAGGRYRFDAPRNLALVRAMVEDPAARVQYIFVAAWLKRLMLDEARRQKLPPDTIARLDEVLHQPSDSNPHADHFHVRVFCTIADRLEGCRDRGPRRAWIDPGDEPWAERVALLARVVREVDAPRLQRDALDRLADLRGVPALPTLLATLASPRDDLRNAALRTIRALDTLEATEGLLAAARETSDPSWAVRLFGAALAPGDPAIAEVALRAVAEPEAILHPDALKGARAGVVVAACRALARFGKADAAGPLFALLEDPERDVRVAAHEALLRVTNQRVAGAGLASRHARRQRAVVSAWRAFLDREGDSSWLQWLRLGFEARGIRFHRRMASRDGIERLIEAITHRDDVLSDNAVRALSEITGHYVDPAWRNKRNNQRHWRAWWREHAEVVALP